MTREEQIRQAALEACRSSEIPDKELNFRGVNSAYGLGFCEGAMWADRNPKDEVNWQQVRIQAAISAMQGILSNESRHTDAIDSCGDEYTIWASIAIDSVEYANALVKELKGE